ncbi:hypothetical protein FGIG_08244 [Fasciola gigantica]|uniref:Uncharacterized protein n=1 Tax=Fasciola gigantica TaxID=46835 RepID=A0A504YIG2_FASGI|nr:hypothetical protein FGIG_08244 [Fasciola gigantica]
MHHGPVLRWRIQAVVTMNRVEKTVYLPLNMALLNVLPERGSVQ